jgi:hypothetical protein
MKVLFHVNAGLLSVIDERTVGADAFDDDRVGSRAV